MDSSSCEPSAIFFRINAPFSISLSPRMIAQAAPAGVWSRADFLDIGTPNAVEKALQRLKLRGDIRRPYRGLYDKPSIGKLTGKIFS